MMPAALQLLLDCEGAGLSLEVRAGQLVVTPKRRATPDLAARIEAHAAELVALVGDRDRRAARQALRCFPAAVPMAGKSRLAVSFGSCPPDEPDPAYEALAAWFLDLMEAGRLPAEGAIHLETAVTIDDPARCWAWLKGRIEGEPRGDVRTETRVFLTKLKRVLEG